MKKYAPWIVFAVFAAWVAGGLRPPRPTSAFNTADFGRLPVLLNGRVQPLDSVARNALLIMRGKQSVALADGQSLPAIDWLMEVTMKPEVGDTRKCFRIDHPDLRGMLKLPIDGPFYHAFTELQPHLDEIGRQSDRIMRIDPQQRRPDENAIVKLSTALNTYQRLRNTLRPENSKDFAAELAEFQKALPAGQAAAQAREEGRDYNKEDLERILRLAQPLERLANLGYALVIPPTDPAHRRDGWETLGASLISTIPATGTLNPAVTGYLGMVTAFRRNQPAEFNRALADYRQFLGSHFRPELQKGEREFVYNTWRPFAKSIVLYTLVFLLGLFSWFGWFEVLNRTAFRLLFLAFLVHSAGIVFRMVLEGRPPVTNLYSSAVFVGWGAVALGLVLERFYRDSIGIVMAAAVGLITQIVAHNLSLDGDTMVMLQAVLDTNFWLATHVITVTLGYAATFVAGFLAVIYVLLGVFSKKLYAPVSATATAAAVPATPGKRRAGPKGLAAAGQAIRREPMNQVLARMVYTIVCFATLFSFVGTVLGGIWADQSWGRFWGWDPKENGALIIVLWNAIILHARWGRLVQERGLINLAIFGNIVTSYSWFGVNMLGVGLHSYGFMQSAFYWLMLFVLSQFVLIGLGCLPAKYWASLRAQTPPLPSPAPAA